MTNHYKSRASTHADNCWSWGHGHYECAVREIEALRQALATLKAENEMLRKVLKEADNELDWLDEEVDTCDHSVGVCVCDYWDMRRKMKAALAPQRGNADIALLVFAVVCAVWLVIAGAMGWLPGGGL